MRLYTYFRSGAAHRVRIALELKSIAYESVPVHLLRDGGEQNAASYLAVNPQGRVPTLVLADGTALLQSSAIIDYLEETHPTPPLLPTDPVARARVRAVAAIIGCDIHPLNNLAVLTALRGLGQEERAVAMWTRQWIERGLHAVERLIGDAIWCFGPEPGLADVYLIPQLFSARRFGADLAAFPRVRRVSALADHHEAFARAAPGHQPDAE